MPVLSISPAWEIIFSSPNRDLLRDILTWHAGGRIDGGNKTVRRELPMLLVRIRTVQKYGIVLRVLIFYTILEIKMFYNNLEKICIVIYYFNANVFLLFIYIYNYISLKYINFLIGNWIKINNKTRPKCHEFDNCQIVCKVRQVLPMNIFIQPSLYRERLSVGWSTSKKRKLSTL